MLVLFARRSTSNAPGFSHNGESTSGFDSSSGICTTVLWPEGCIARQWGRRTGMFLPCSCCSMRKSRRHVRSAFSPCTYSRQGWSVAHTCGCTVHATELQCFRAETSACRHAKCCGSQECCGQAQPVCKILLPHGKPRESCFRKQHRMQAQQNTVASRLSSAHLRQLCIRL